MRLGWIFSLAAKYIFGSLFRKQDVVRALLNSSGVDVEGRCNPLAIPKYPAIIRLGLESFSQFNLWVYLLLLFTLIIYDSHILWKTFPISFMDPKFYLKILHYFTWNISWWDPILFQMVNFILTHFKNSPKFPLYKNLG